VAAANHNAPARQTPSRQDAVAVAINQKIAKRAFACLKVELQTLLYGFGAGLIDTRKNRAPFANISVWIICPP
jgi:hypothetical protein